MSQSSYRLTVGDSYITNGKFQIFTICLLLAALSIMYMIDLQIAVIMINVQFKITCG